MYLKTCSPLHYFLFVKAHNKIHCQISSAIFFYVFFSWPLIIDTFHQTRAHSNKPAPVLNLTTGPYSEIHPYCREILHLSLHTHTLKNKLKYILGHRMQKHIFVYTIEISKSLCNKNKIKVFRLSIWQMCSTEAWKWCLKWNNQVSDTSCPTVCCFREMIWDL